MKTSTLANDIFLGRDGLVKAIHTGYAGPATSGDNRGLEKERTTLVERFPAGKQSPERSKPVQHARSETRRSGAPDQLNPFAGFNWERDR